MDRVEFVEKFINSQYLTSRQQVLVFKKDKYVIEVVYKDKRVTSLVIHIGPDVTILTKDELSKMTPVIQSFLGDWEEYAYS